MKLYGIQTYAHWDDYPCWIDYEDYETSPSRPLRFTSRKKAETWLQDMLDQDYQKRLTYWQSQETKRQENQARQEKQNELYQARKQALINAGLWVQEGEGMSPLVHHSTFRHATYPEPERDIDKKYWRIVRDEDMDTPLADSYYYRTNGYLLNGTLIQEGNKS